MLLCVCVCVYVRVWVCLLRGVLVWFLCVGTYGTMLARKIFKNCKLYMFVEDSE